ncbi:MAG: hypothetical protein NUW37_12570 [Planctomycetes bacterium]|nr:hypothetical protein [Planctomycetota bacterium]
MRKIVLVSAFIAWAFVFAGVAKAELLAGFASADITPEKPVPMAGHGNRRGQPSQGVREPVLVFAAVFDEGGKRMCIVSADLLGVRVYARDAVLALLPAELGITTENFFACATGTLSGPGGVNPPMNPLVDTFLDNIFGKYDKAIFDGIVGKIADCIVEAARDLAPCQLGFRRVIEPRFIRAIRVINGTRDVEMNLLKATGADGKTRALFVGYGCGAGASPWTDFKISPDIPGWTRSALARITGEDYPVFWLSSEALDANHDLREEGYELEPEPEVEILPEEPMSLFNLPDPGDPLDQPTEEEALERYRLGEEIASRIAERIAQESARIRTAPDAQFSVTSSLETMPRGDGLGGMFSPRQVVFMSVRIADALFACVPGKASAVVINNLKAKMRALGFRYTFVVCNANEYVGPILHPSAFDKTNELENFLYRDDVQGSSYGPGIAMFLERRMLEPYGLEVTSYEEGGELSWDVMEESIAEGSGANAGDTINTISRASEETREVFRRGGSLIRRLFENSLLPDGELRRLAEREREGGEARNPAPSPVQQPRTIPAPQPETPRRGPSRIGTRPAEGSTPAPRPETTPAPSTPAQPQVPARPPAPEDNPDEDF